MRNLCEVGNLSKVCFKCVNLCIELKNLLGEKKNPPRKEGKSDGVFGFFFFFFLNYVHLFIVDFIHDC